MCLGNRFVDRWRSKEKEPSVASKILGVAKSQVSLKEQIGLVTSRLDVQTRGLDAAIRRFELRDAEIFGRVVRAMEARDQARANIYATELGEIRKVEKMLNHASLALQSVSMRLSTVSEMGDVVAALSPARAVLGSVRGEMCSIFPEASAELGNIGNLLSDICVSTSNESTAMPMDVRVANEEALKILEEAEVAAEVRLKDRLPEIDAAASASGRRASLGV